MTKWTVETLKEHFERILIEKDKAIDIALASAKEAVQKSENSQRDYNAMHNDLQRKMEGQYGNMVPRQEFNAYKESVEKAQAIEKTRADKDEGKGMGLSDAWKIALGALGGAAIIYGFVK